MSSRDQSIPTTFGVIKIFRNANSPNEPKKEEHVTEKINKRRPKRVPAFQADLQKTETVQHGQYEAVEPVLQKHNDENPNLDFFGLEKADPVAKDSEPEQLGLKSVQKVTKEGDDSSFGSIAELKEKKAVPKTTAEIPLVASRKLVYDEESPGGPRLSKRKDEDAAKAGNKKLSNHKLLHQEVPQWFNKTQDEAVDILFKRICYFNEEGELMAILERCFSEQIDSNFKFQRASSRWTNLTDCRA